MSDTTLPETLSVDNDHHDHHQRHIGDVGDGGDGRCLLLRPEKGWTRSSSLPESARAFDEIANVLSAPDRGLTAEFDALGKFAFPDASPPRRTADGDQGQNLRQPNEAGFGQDWAGEIHGEHPWSFGDARY